MARRAAPLAITIAWAGWAVTVTQTVTSPVDEQAACLTARLQRARDRLSGQPQAATEDQGAYIVECPTTVQRLDFLAATQASIA